MMSTTASPVETVVMSAPARIFERLFLLAGAGCLLRTNSPALAKSLEQVTSAWGEHPALNLEITVRTGDESPLEVPHFRGMHHVVVMRFGAANVFVMDLQRCTVIGTISEIAAEDIEFWQRTLLPIIAGIAGTSMGVLAAHSACLARESDGMLIAGESGAGKSTLSVALAQRRFDYISDDWTYCSVRDGELVAHGMEARTKLLPDAARHFPELAGHATGISMNGELAYEVRAEETFSVRMRTSCRPRMLVFLKRTESAPARFRRLDPEVARRYFARNVERIPEQMERARVNRAALVEELLALPCWSFEYSGPPDVGAERLETFFEEQRRTWGTHV